jgi:TRAP-type C4-dicarboxylate transport system permease large subunit
LTRPGSPPVGYREADRRDPDSARLSGVIGLSIGVVGAFGWAFTVSFPLRVAGLVTTVAPTSWLFLVVAIVLSVSLEMFLTSLSALVRPADAGPAPWRPSAAPR